MDKKQRRFLLIYFFLLVGFLNIYANNNTDSIIYGKVIHEHSKKPMQDVSVVLYKKDSIINGTLTNKKGVFKITNLAIGKYQLQISFMGFKTIRKNVEITDNKTAIAFEIIELIPDITYLEAVEIRSEKTNITQEIDKQVVHVGKDLLAIGATALEILSNLPSVTIDGNNKISYRGSPNVIIYVDGKPTNINPEDVLNQIPANTIKKIELISNPSARYNPEGLNGIINLVLIKNSNLGFHGILNSGVTFANKTSSNSSLNMNFKKGKFNFFTNLGYIDKNKERDGYFNHTFNNVLDEYITNSQKKSKLIKLGFDFDITKQQTFSFYTYQNFLTTDKNKLSNTTTNADFYKLEMNNVFDNKEHIYNVNYTYNFKKEGEKLEMEVNYDTNSVSQDNSQTNITQNLQDYQDNITINRDYTIVNVDYQNSFKKDIKIELGTETRIHKANNKLVTTRANVAPNAIFDYNRNENSIYATFSQKINKKYSYKIGSRVESYIYKSILNGNEIFKKDYLTLYPSFYFVYKKNKRNRFQIGYSKHIFRPTINQVNPTSVWNSSVMTFEGNPTLKPTFVDYFEFIYTYKLKKGIIRLTPYYQINRNTIYQSLATDPNNSDKLILSYENGKINHRKSLEFTFYYKLKKWWTLSIGGFFTTFTQEGIVNNQNKKFTQNQTNVSIYQSFKINSKLRITLFGKYNGAKQTLQFKTNPSGKIDFATKYKVLKNKASITLRFSDIFDTLKYTFYADAPYTQKGLVTLDSQAVYIGFSYDFGTKKIKNRKRKKHEKQVINSDAF